MQTDYPLTSGYSFSRAVFDTLGEPGSPVLASERTEHARIKAQFQATKLDTPIAEPGHRVDPKRQTFKGEFDRVAYVPFSAFGAFERADIGGNLGYQVFFPYTPIYGGSVIAHSQVVRAGAVIIPGCQGQQMPIAVSVLPVPTWSANADGTSQLADSAPTFIPTANGPSYGPLRLGVKVTVSKQLLKQAAWVEGPLRDVLSRALSSVLDNTCLYGTGTGGQPTGLTANTSVTNTLLAAQMVYTDWLSARATIKATDVDPAGFGTITCPSVEQTLSSVQAFTGSAYSIRQMIEPAFIGNEVNAKNVFLGIWNNFVIFLWGSGIEIIFDEYSAADGNTTVVRATLLANCYCMQPQAFTVLHWN
jgi:hypothetical protein